VPTQSAGFAPGSGYLRVCFSGGCNLCSPLNAQILRHNTFVVHFSSQVAYDHNLAILFIYFFFFHAALPTMSKLPAAGCFSCSLARPEHTRLVFNHAPLLRLHTTRSTTLDCSVRMSYVTCDVVRLCTMLPLFFYYYLQLQIKKKVFSADLQISRCQSQSRANPDFVFRVQALIPC
jgi:hypothetical protein